MNGREGVRLDPSIEAILREVARDSGSALLRVPRAQVVPTLLEERRTVGPASAGLSLAERELVQVHRNEVAWLLREACAYGLTEGPNTKGRFVRFPSSQSDRPGVEAIARRARNERECCEVGEDTNIAFELLGRCVDDIPHGRLKISKLAAASYRLQPTEQARLLAGAALAFESSPLAAIRSLRAVVDHTSNRQSLCSAWSIIGMAFAAVSEPKSAHTAYRLACAVRDGQISPVFNRLLFATQVGNRDDVRATAQLLASLDRPQIDELEAFVSLQVHHVKHDVWKPTRVAVELVRGIREVTGGPARRILDVFEAG